MSQQPNWKKPLILAVVLAFVGSLTYWLEYTHKPKKEAAEELTKKPFNLKDKTIESLKLVDGEKVYAFNCLDIKENLCKSGDQSAWKMTSPMTVGGDKSNVNSLLSALNNLTATEVIDLREDGDQKKEALFREYGLGKNSLEQKSFRRVEVKIKDGDLLVGYLGATHPIGDKIFSVVSANGTLDKNSVYLLSSSFKNNFDHELTYWRDKTIFSFQAQTVVSIDYKGSKSKLKIERNEGKWVLNGNFGGKAENVPGDIENIDNFLTSLSYLKAKEFLEKKDLKNSKKTIELTLVQQASGDQAAKAPAPIKITFFHTEAKKAKGKKKPVSEKLFVTASHLDPVFEVNTSEKEKYDKEAKHFRLSKLITSMERFTVKQLEFAGKPIGVSPLKVLYKESKWEQSLGDKKQEIPEEKIQGILDKITGNKIKDFYTEKKIPGGESNGLKVWLKDEKGSVLREFIFWRNKDKTELYAKDVLSKRKEALKVDVVLANALPWNADHFTKKPSEVKKMDKPNPKGIGSEAGHGGHNHGNGHENGHGDDGHGHKH